MSKRACALCGRDPAAGFAKVNDDWYCHGDDDEEPTCYMVSQRIVSLVARVVDEHPDAFRKLADE